MLVSVPSTRPAHGERPASHAAPPGDRRIWIYALGYFACYVPYAALTKLMSQGRVPGVGRAIQGLELLPAASAASAVAMVLFVTWRGWWAHASHRVAFGRRIPVPGAWTFLSGLATAGIIATTTLAYTFDGTSIVFMMLLMRGGVLVLAPVVDALARREVRAASWVALGLSLAALATALADGASYVLSALAALDVAIYLAGYFVRLRLMSRLAKSGERASSLRYFVEETMVASPALLVMLALGALVGGGPASLALRAGFAAMATPAFLLPAAVIGALSQGTGVFGALILLDGRENTYCVSVNRASSVVAGALATAALAWAGRGRAPALSELVGATLLAAALVALGLRGGPRPKAPALRGDAPAHP